jgi:hypothetical protein
LNGVELKKQTDGSYLATGPHPGNTDYILDADTKAAGITGIRLEVLPVVEEGNAGPGRASDGNFVLGELVTKTGDFATRATDPVKYSGAIADFSQANFEVAKAVDGRKGDGNNGWAVAPQFGVPHFAAFQFEKPLGNAEKGIRIEFDMNMPRTGSFAIARFRFWYTTESMPLNIGLPLPVAEALRKPASQRGKEEQAAVTVYWNESDPELSKLRLAAGKLALPLPTDPGILERRAAQARAEQPIKLDAKLVQLRQDAAQSKAQIANKRLTGAQDLAWALINNPAFLFNH